MTGIKTSPVVTHGERGSSCQTSRWVRLLMWLGKKRITLFLDTTCAHMLVSSLSCTFFKLGKLHVVYFPSCLSTCFVCVCVWRREKDILSRIIISSISIYFACMGLLLSWVERPRFCANDATGWLTSERVTKSSSLLLLSRIHTKVLLSKHIVHCPTTEKLYTQHLEYVASAKVCLESFVVYPKLFNYIVVILNKKCSHLDVLSHLYQSRVV